MKNISYLKDKTFLRALDNESNKFYWVKIEVLNMEELPVESIAGKVQPGSTISIDGSSSVRRTCTISFVAEDDENNLIDIDNLLSINKKIKIYEGIENHINEKHDDIIWFPLGIFIIVQPSISHTASGCIINLSCKDKMCLLNGECGGTLPASVTFHEYNQMIGERECEADPATIEDLEPNNYTVYSYLDSGVLKYKTWTKEYGWVEVPDNSLVGEVVQVPQLIYDIVQTLVCNYGGEALENIFINDLPLEIKQIVRYTGSGTLYYNTDTSQYTTDEAYLTEDGVWRSFKYNEDVGYVYTDFVYPGSLISNIGDNVCTILDKIKSALGNFEYFYDVNGKFVFQEVKNYLNNSYDPTDQYRLDNNRKIEIAENDLSIIDDTNYTVDFNSNTKSVYTFQEGNGLITSYANTPSYMNLKNDFHIWGKNKEGFAIHYHMAIKEKPFPIVYKNTSELTEEQIELGYQANCDYDQFDFHKIVYILDENDEFTGRIRLATDSDDPSIVENYIPIDWRAELYIRGLMKQDDQIRPDVYEQELLDLFDAIYNFKEKKFKADLVKNPNDLQYFFDYLEPVSKLYDCSVDLLNTKIHSYQQDKIIKLYDTDIPNVIIIDLGMDIDSRAKIIERCEREGQPYANVESSIYDNISIGTVGYSAQEVARELLYQYTNYNEQITLQSIPIYYLDANSRITVYDKKAGIYGDYIIKSISIPLDSRSNMNITANKALERI